MQGESGVSRTRDAPFSFSFPDGVVPSAR